MAKISARGHHKVAALTVEQPNGQGRTRYVLRSDGAILIAHDFFHEYAFSGSYWNTGSYSIHPKYGPVAEGTARDEALVERFMAMVRTRQAKESKGWRVVTWKAERQTV